MLWLSTFGAFMNHLNLWMERHGLPQRCPSHALVVAVRGSEGFLSLEQGMQWTSARRAPEQEKLSTFVNERLVQCVTRKRFPV